MAAAMPGMMRRMRHPRARLIVNAASVQAAKSVPHRPDICGASGLLGRAGASAGGTGEQTLTRVAPGGHGPGEKREPGTLFALCDYLMLFDLS